MGKKKEWDKDDLTQLNPMSKSNAFALKFYNEQLPFGEQVFVNMISTFDKNEVWIFAIKHYRDEVTDGVWAIALEKPHWHVLVKFVDRTEKKRVIQILRQLRIHFRPGLDDNLLQNKAIETVGSLEAYVTYLTHETKKAILQNKELYDVSEIISNLTIEEIKHIREGYMTLESLSRKVSIKDLAKLDKQAFQLGYEMKNFNDWYNELPFNIRSQSKMKTIKESYYRGSEKRLEEDAKILRLCVFIKGDGNSGKTYTSKEALKGKKIHNVSGGGTGKFDTLRPDHEAIIIDDDTCPNLLNMSDNFMCHAYKRREGNPIWSGQYLIVTSNLSFADWVEACGIKNKKNYQATESRFFICEIRENQDGVYYLACAQASTRGTLEEQQNRANMFMEFKRKFDEIISHYVPSQTKVNYDAIIDDAYKGERSLTNVVNLISTERMNTYCVMSGNPYLKNHNVYEANKHTYMIFNPLPEEKG